MATGLEKSRRLYPFWVHGLQLTGAPMKSSVVARLTLFIGLFAALSSPYTAFAAAALNPDAELGVYRFYGSYNTSSAQVGVYRLHDGLWIPKQGGSISLQDPAKTGCETALLSNLQSFPLNVMTTVNYLNPGELSNQEQLIKLFSPEQVTFFELTEPVLKTTVAADPKTYPAFKIAPRPDEARPDHAHVRQAGMWLISGQSMYPWGGDTFAKHHPQSVNEPMDIHFQTAIGHEPRTNRNVHDPHLILLTITPMPWQNNPQLWESGAMKKTKFGYADLDRKKYPLTWEIGRAAQTKPEQMTALFTAAAAVIAEEVEVTMQSRFDDAFVFCKALDEDRMRLFRMIGFEPLEGACPKPDSCVMVAPLTKLLKRFPVGKQSGYAKQIREALNNKLDTNEALNILRRIQVYFRAELDLILKDRGYHQKSPIVVHDFSRNYLTLLRIFGERFGELNTDDAIKFARRFAKIRGDFGDKRHVVEDIPVDIFMDEFTHRNVVRITNLDAGLVGRDSEYLPTVLVGVRNYLAERYDELLVNDPHTIAERLDTKIAIQTWSWRTASEAHKLGGMQLPPLPGTQNRTLYTFIFDMKQIKKMAEQDPERVERARKGGIQQGFWFFRRITANPIKF